MTKLMTLVCALLMAFTAEAQEKSVKKKPIAKKQAAHKKPTPEQIKKFNQLRKQREAKG